jgi:hypothetical protein
MARWEAPSLSESRTANSFQVPALLAALAVGMFAGTARAQYAPNLRSEPTSQKSPAASPDNARKSSPNSEKPAREGHERILGIIPAFEVTNLQHPPALTPRQKLGLFARQAMDPFQWLVSGGAAGVNQANNTWPGYGQGFDGYAKRFGAAAADATDRGFMSNLLFPVLLKQDPRYFRLGRGRILRRIGYSLGQEWWGKTDRGTRQFNYSKVLGAFAAMAVSNTYYPSGDRGVRRTMRNSGFSLLAGMGTGLAAEFWPDIACKVFGKCRLR